MEYAAKHAHARATHRNGRIEVIDCYRDGFGALVDHPVPLLALGFGVCALVWAAWGLVGLPFIGALVGFAFAALVSTPLTFGFAYVCLRAVRDDEVEPGEVASVYDRYLDAALAAALTAGLVLVGLAFFVVPGVYLLVRFAFVPYLIVEEHRSATDAMFESFERTQGHGWAILALGVCRLVLFGVGSATFGLLIVPGAVWSDLALASLYARASGRTRAADIGIDF